MDYKFLNKVLGQIVRETEIDYRGRGKIFTPFLSPYLSFLFISSSLSLHHFPFSTNLYLTHFTKHCNEVYGLNIEEIEYVWEEYRRIIKDKIENNGL